MKLAKWRSDPIDGMNNYGIKIVDNTLRCFRIYEGKAFGDIALMVIRKLYKKFHIILNVVYFIHLKCMVYFFKVRVLGLIF